MQSKPVCSVIIPTLNEEELIKPLVKQLLKSDFICTVIVVDGWSKDRTLTRASKAWATVLVSPVPWRAIQMNMGATKAKDECNVEAKNHYLWFVHADVLLPKGRDKSIQDAISDGYTAGCFRSKYDWKSTFLRSTTTNFTKYNHWFFRMGGQTVRLREKDFFRVWPYDPKKIIAEEIELYHNLYKDETTHFKVLEQEVIVSARKHEINGVLYTNIIYAILYVMYWLWVSQDLMVKFYTATIKSDRLASAEEYWK